MGGGHGAVAGLGVNGTRITHEMGMVVRPRGSRAHELLRNRIARLVALTFAVDLVGTTLAWLRAAGFERIARGGLHREAGLTLCALGAH